MLLSHLALPCEGHLEQLFQIIGYPKKYHNTKLVHDPSDPEINPCSLREGTGCPANLDMLMVEELPPNIQEPHGMGFTIRAKVDADHVSDTVSRRSRTGFLVYLNCAFYWWSKKQMSVESSSFGDKFIAMKQCCEYLRRLRYKL